MTNILRGDLVNGYLGIQEQKFLVRHALITDKISLLESQLKNTNEVLKMVK